MRSITENVRQLYAAYFGRLINEKPWTPSVVCHSCVIALQKWATKKRDSMPFGVPMLWSEAINHVNDCYFCVTNVRGMKKCNRSSWNYPDLASARRPRPHSDTVPIPIYQGPQAELGGVEEHLGEDTAPESDAEADELYVREEVPQKFDQPELNDLIRDLRLPKESAELLASRLKEKNLLAPGVTAIPYDEQF